MLADFKIRGRITAPPAVTFFCVVPSVNTRVARTVILLYDTAWLELQLRPMVSWARWVAPTSCETAYSPQSKATPVILRTAISFRPLPIKNPNPKIFRPHTSFSHIVQFMTLEMGGSAGTKCHWSCRKFDTVKHFEQGERSYRPYCFFFSPFWFRTTPFYHPLNPIW